MAQKKLLHPTGFSLLPVLLVLLSSCAGKQIPLKTAKPWTPRMTLHSLSAWAEVDLSVKGRAESFQAALLAEGPDRLRIQILDDLGREKALLIANGRQVYWWNRREGGPQIYPQDPKVLRKTLKLPLGVQEFIAQLLEGTAAQDGHNNSYQIVVEEISRTEEGLFPRLWTWYFSKPKATLSVLFSHLRLNPVLGAEKFDF